MKNSQFSNSIQAGKKLGPEFYRQDAVTVARQLLGKTLVRRHKDGSIARYTINETEAYCGEEDKACHASKGRTARTEVMYHAGGTIYIYLIYGMYWMLNVVTGETDDPQAVLIRGISGQSGPGRVGRTLDIDKTLNGESLLSSSSLWIEDAPEIDSFITTPRIGIDYAEENWRNKPWRFIIANEEVAKP